MNTTRKQTIAGALIGGVAMCYGSSGAGWLRRSGNGRWE